MLSSLFLEMRVFIIKTSAYVYTVQYSLEKVITACYFMGHIDDMTEWSMYVGH